MRVGGPEVGIATAGRLPLDVADQTLHDEGIVFAGEALLPRGKQARGRPAYDGDHIRGWLSGTGLPRALRDGQGLLDSRQERPQGCRGRACLGRACGRREPRQDLASLV